MAGMLNIFAYTLNLQKQAFIFLPQKQCRYEYLWEKAFKLILCNELSKYIR